MISETEYGPRRVSVTRGGFQWSDEAWRFLAFDGRFYAYGRTDEEAWELLAELVGERKVEK